MSAFPTSIPENRIGQKVGDMKFFETMLAVVTIAIATTAFAQEDPGGMMAAQGCMSLEPKGTASVTVNGEASDGGAVFKPGPAGEAFVAIGALEGARPVWCLTILTAEPVDGQTLAVFTPEDVLQTKSGALVVMAVPASDQDTLGSYFYASEGTVSFEAGEILKGELNVKGVREAGDTKVDIEVGGTFEAVAAE